MPIAVGWIFQHDVEQLEYVRFYGSDRQLPVTVPRRHVQSGNHVRFQYKDAVTDVDNATLTLSP